MATHHPAETRTATPAISRPRIRRTKLPDPATSSAKANPGTTRKTWSCLVRNPRPTATPVRTYQRKRSSSMARNAE